MNPLDRIRILIVENEGLVGCDMSTQLANIGYLVVGTVKSGEQALGCLEELHPDLVLMDVHLDGQLDGIETAKLMRAKSAVAIIYVTACADLETVARARETQPHGYLLKPFSEDELRLTVELAATRYLEESENRRRENSYFQAFQSLADGVIATDLAGGIIFVNPAATRITGWSAEEMVGKSLNEAFRIFLADGMPAEVQVVDESGTSPLRTVWLTNRLGERVAIHDRTTAIRDQRNSLTGLVILFGRASVTAPIAAHANPPTQPSLQELALNAPEPQPTIAAAAFASAPEAAQVQPPETPPIYPEPPPHEAPAPAQ